MKSILLFLFAGALTAGLVACQPSARSENYVASQPEEIPLVEIATVQELQPTKHVVLPGELKPWNRVNIYPKVKGFVKMIYVDRGTYVKKGQVLAMLDAPEVFAELNGTQSQMNAANAALAEQKAEYEASKLTFTRLLRTSQTEGAVSQNELDQARARMLADSALVVASSSQAHAARSNYQAKIQLAQYLTITAPFEGIITERNISLGALVGVGDNNGKPLFVLEDNTTLRLTIAVPEAYANQIPDTGHVQFGGNAIPEKQFTASFARSSRSLQEANRVMLVEFDVANQRLELKAGMYAEVWLPVIRQFKTLFVPKESVVSNSENVFLIRLRQNQTEWVPVKKGNIVDSLVEVFGEIQPGNLIVRKASEEIREGQTVRIAK